MQTFFEAYLLNLKELHRDILAAIDDLSPAALDWSPSVEMNSINALVTHTVGAQRFLIGEAIAGDPANRDRDAEFKVRGLEAETLVIRLNDSLDYVRATLDGLTIDELPAERDFRGRKSTVGWILQHALKHTAIHLGHVQLMRQMWELYGSNN